MENKLRGNFDKACQAREELPDEVKRWYEAMGHLAFSKKMYPQSANSFYDVKNLSGLIYMNQ